MTFSEFLNLLHRYCAGVEGRFKADFVAMIIEIIMEENTDEVCPVLDSDKGFLRSIFAGREPLPTVSARIMISHLDKERFSDFIQERLSADTAVRLAQELVDLGYTTDGTYESIGCVCADIYERILLDITGGNTRIVPKKVSKKEEAAEVIFQLRKRLDGIRPPEVPMPDEIMDEEQVYVRELYNAYGSACAISGFCEDHLKQEEYAGYREDLSDRRIEYFAAESIKRGTQEVFGGEFADQFEVLKQETYDGIKNTIRRKYPDGYERMLAVMEQAVRISVDKYLLATTPYWIGNDIKCGVCHHLVNEKRMKWI